MRALHLFANWKWTGPAEIAVNVCLGLRARGLDVRFACGRSPDGEPGKTTVRERALSRGLAPVLEETTLSKHHRLFANWADARRVRRYVEREGIALVHAHSQNDHSIARRALGRSASVRLVRTSYDGGPMKSTLRLRRALVLTDALIFASRETRADAVARLGFPEDRAFLVESPVDTARFDPARDPSLAGRGARISGTPPGAFVVGIVARMQTHRNFEVFLEAIRRVRERAPEVAAVVVGRGTNQETVAKEPARRMGLGEVVRFPGYLDGEDYVAALACMDAKVFLVPGSDGSCRAVREALAMGRPVVAARRGMLPEIVRDGETGLVVEDGDPEALARALLALRDDPARRARMSEAARADARARFSIESAAAEVARIYEATLARPRRHEAGAGAGAGAGARAPAGPGGVGAGEAAAGAAREGV
jgi:glycosyltransferase involved in cell wall biosynthesis